jgi:hypothetical protein
MPSKSTTAFAGHAGFFRHDKHVSSYRFIVKFMTNSARWGQAGELRLPERKNWLLGVKATLVEHA